MLDNVEKYVASRTLTEPLAGNHQVTGIVRSDQGDGLLRALGAEAVHADVLDREALLRAVDGRAFDAVVHELTALKKAPARFADMHAARRGTYRVVYRIDEQLRTVTVVDVAHRRDVYR